MTKKEMFVAIREVVAGNEEMVAFIDKEIALLERKASTPRKPTKTQIENETLKAIIVEFLEGCGERKTIKALQAEIPELAELSNQRITHLLTDLVNGKVITKEYVKKTPYFFIAA